MSDESKNKSAVGISLDELPTEDPLKADEEAARRRINAFKDKKKFEQAQALDVRARTLAGLPPETQLEQMNKVYEFDKKEPRFELLFLYLSPLLIKHLGLYQQFMTFMLKQTNENNFILDVLISFLGNLGFLVNFSEVLFVVLFLFKAPFRSTHMRFIINFEGIDLPHKLRIKSTDPHQRRRIKWSQISSVKLNTDFIHAIELFNDKSESLGMLRWDLWKRDKKSFEKIVSKYIGDKHPLRLFVSANG